MYVCACVQYTWACVTYLIFIFSFPPGENDAFRYITVILSAFGLVLTDFFYLAAVIHYALECQLIIFLIRATADRIRSRCWAVDDAIKVNKISFQFRFNSILLILLYTFMYACQRRILMKPEGYGPYGMHIRDTCYCITGKRNSLKHQLICNEFDKMHARYVPQEYKICLQGFLQLNQLFFLHK